MRSMGLFLRKIRETLPEAIVDEEGLERIIPILDFMPADFSNFWGFECRLKEEKPRVDVLFEVRRENFGRRILSGEVESPLDGLCDEHEAWKRIREFSRNWNGTLKDVRNLWLEFDTAHSDPPSAFRNPSFFFGPSKSIKNGEGLLNLVSDVAETLKDGLVPLNTLSDFLSCLPCGASVFQIGFMWSRESDLLRVCIKGLSGDGLTKVMRDMGWRGDINSLVGWVSSFSNLSKDIALDFDLTQDGLGEKVGVECYMDWLSEENQQWIPLLDFLEELSLSLAKKSEGLLMFKGLDPCPEGFRLSERGVLYPKYSRRIHHIKVNLTNGTPTEAKAYLAISRPGLILSENCEDRDWWLVET